MKAVFRLFLIVLLPLTAYAGDFCVKSTEADKTYDKKLQKSEKDLLETLLEQVYPILEKDLRYKNILTVVKQGCWIINHDPKYTNVLFSYSAEVDENFRPRDQTLCSKASPDSTIRLNVTEKLIKLLAFAKEQRGDNDQIQPAVLGYAGSYLVRSAWIAMNYMRTPMRDLRNSLKDGKNVTSEEVLKIVGDQKTKVRIEREGIQLQQEFAQEYLDEGLNDWVVKTSADHPDFFHEKLLYFRDGDFYEYDTAWFDGQYRVGEIVRDLLVTRSAYTKDLPEQTLENGRAKIKDLQSEWRRYINDTPESKEVFQDFVMEKVLTPFVIRYEEEIQLIPDFLK